MTGTRTSAPEGATGGPTRAAGAANVTVRESSASSRRRSGLAWAIIAAVLVGGGILGAVFSSAGGWTERVPLDPAGAGPRGTLALVSVLREQGVEVVVARDRPAALGALGPETTLVMPDAPMLSDEALTELVDAAGDAVLLDPRSRTARLFFAGSSPAGMGLGDVVDPGCSLPDAERAGPVAPRALYTAGDADAACYPVDGGFGLLVDERSATSRVALVDATELVTNESLTDDGNAALALGLMGRHPVVVWYMPAFGDSDLAPGDRSLGELTPPWVTPTIVLLLCAAVAAAFWRGRRFGPLVVEDLPVTVRASETMEGRARLYAGARDALHATDALRIGALGRLGALLGLGPAASSGDVADAAADRIGAPRAAVRDILIDSLPSTDRELVAVSDRIRDLEAAVHAAVRTERNAP